MYIKEIIRRAAKYKKKSYADMARALGITPQTYANTLSRGNFQAETIEKIADVLGCDLVFVDRATGNAFFSSDQHKDETAPPRRGRRAKDQHESPHGKGGKDQQ
jgi:transcriptional regulator with XRE-family HTH domain